MPIYIERPPIDNIDNMRLYGRGNISLATLSYVRTNQELLQS